MSGLRLKQKEQRRAQIEQAARELFEEKGFDPTRIEEIAQRAMVSPATVYNYYGTKGEVLLALVAQGEVGTAQSIDRHVGKTADRTPEDLIAEVICANMEDTLQALSRGLWGHVVAYVATTSDETVGPRYIHLIADDLARALEAVMKAYQAKGLFRNDLDVEALAYLLTRLERNHFLGYVYLKSMTLDELEAGVKKDVATLVQHWKV
ncbi:TetR/AcrR family transcriptional regulator [Emcibacter sp.]|uniref:TetR/AcrR family transcriptional regulator n=1 Tax=Emcibacter sp. TaxID=1979954 RepID=UPI002AA80B00|nr:TetR/AcrR family transcriptional regulator [Emcibacter sp.]